MRLQKFPILALAAIGLLLGWTPAFGHGGFGGGGRGGGGFGGGNRFVGGGARGFITAGPRGFVAAGPRGFVAAGPRGFVAGRSRFGPAVVGERFGNRGYRHFHPGRYNYGGGFVGGYPYYAYGNPYAYAPGYSMESSAPDYAATPVPAYGGAQCPTLFAGDVVGNVQRVLRFKGFYRGPIDGLSGPTLRAAIRAYDVSVGLPPTGVIDERLLLAMGLM